MTVTLPTDVEPGDQITIHVSNESNGAIDNAKICIQGLEFYRVGYTDSNGNLTITLSEDAINAGETLTVTVSKHDFVSTTKQMILAGGIDISTSQIFYNEEKATIDLYSITANSSHASIGMIDEGEATIYSYSIYSAVTGNTSITGDLEYDSTNKQWYKENISLTTLTNGEYYVYCVFRTALDVRTIGPKSKTFTLTHTIIISPPDLSYNPDDNFLNITNIQAVCTENSIGFVNDTEAISYQYEIRLIDDSISVLSGNLSYISEKWEARNVNVSTLVAGKEYWVIAYFEVIGANGTSPHSNSFRAGYTIIVSTFTINYNNNEQLVDVNDVIATSQNPVYGELDNIEAVNHSYAIYTESGEITAIVDNLEWTGDDWNALDINVSELTFGKYYVTCTFSTVDGWGQSEPSELFRIFDPIAAKITVSTPVISYNNNERELDIDNVLAVCSNVVHGELDDTEAIIHSYQIYSEEDDVTPELAGELTYSSGSWQAEDIDVSSLTKGVYYVKCYFEDSDAIGESNPSELFAVGNFKITVSAPTIEFDSANKSLSIVNVIAICNNSLHGTLDDSEIVSAMYRIYTKGNDYTGINGNLTYNGVSWEARGITVSSLAEGEYYAVCYFRDNDATGQSQASVYFEITAEQNWFEKYWWVLVIIGAAVIIIVIVVVIIVRRRRRFPTMR
jgi:hypothetical protein